GFLAFSEIHPDYYQIPVADRQALIAQEERDQRAADADADNRAGRRGRHRHRGAERHRDRDIVQSEPLPTEDLASGATEVPASEAGLDQHAPDEMTGGPVAMSDPEPASHAVAAEETVHEAAEAPIDEEMIEAPRETIAEGEQPSAAAEGALTADTTFADS